LSESLKFGDSTEEAIYLTDTTRENIVEEVLERKEV
jgi:hypothetical protein